MNKIQKWSLFTILWMCFFPVAVMAEIHAVPQAEKAITQAVALSEKAKKAKKAKTKAMPLAEKAGMQAVPLAGYMLDNRQIDLRNASSQFTLSIPVSRRAPVMQAKLHLRAVNSISLLGNRSQLAVLLNGRVVAQIPLNPKQPEIEADIDLPVSVLRPGYNKLTFSVAQHYGDKCEDPGSPELWVQVDSVRSTLSLDAPLRQWKPRLSELADVFDAKLAGKKRINILTVGRAKLSDNELNWGALAAQGAALRLEYSPLGVRHLRALQSRGTHGYFPGLDQRSLVGSDNILIGTREQLAPFLPADVVRQIKSGFIAIYPLDSDPTHLMVVIAGVNDTQVSMVAHAFSMLNFPYQDTVFAQVDKVEQPVKPDYSAHNTIYPNGQYSFRDLGFQTRTMQGMFSEAQDLSVDIPPALFIKQTDAVALHLRFAYGASMRQDSVLNIFLNGSFANAIALSNSEGGYYRNYIVTLPLHSFHPGSNKLSFIPHMMPLITGDCQTLQTNNLKLTLFDSSRIDMPNVAYYVNLPDLSLFSHTGFPYTVKSGSKNVSVYVPGADADSAAAAWMLMGKLAQTTRLPMFAAQVTSLPPKQTGEWLLLAPLANLPGDILKNAPVQLGENVRLPYPMEGGPGSLEPDLSWYGQIGQFFSDLLVLRPVTEQSQPAYISGSGKGLGRNALAMQFKAPWGSQETVSAFTAGSGDILANSMDDLISNEKWGRLAGDYVIWRNEKDFIYTQRAGSEYVFGEVGFTSRMAYYFNRHPIFWLGGILLLVLALSLVTLRLIMRYKRRYHAKVKEFEADVKEGEKRAD